MDKNISKNKSFSEAPSFAEPVFNVNVSYEELLKTMQRFDEMQRIAQFGTWDWDIKSDEYLLSDGVCHIYGIDTKANKLDHESIVNFMHPDDREAARAALQAAMDEKRPYSVDYRVIRSDGEIRHVHEYGSAVYNNGVPVRAFGSIKDNTENMKLQDKLKESELLYRTLFENTVDAFLIVELIYDANGKVYDFRIIEANNRFQEHTGVNFSAAVGRLASEAKPGIEPYWIETFEKVVEAGKPMHYQNFHEGTNRWYDVYCFPYTQDRVGAIFRDITQYKAAEEALREANESNRQILDSINDGYGMFDRDGKIIKAGNNFAERFGKTPEECIGTNMMDYMPEDKYGDLGKRRIGHFKEVFDTGRPVEFEDTRDGRWFRNRFFPVFADGEIKAVSLFWTDITDSKKAEEEARSNEQLRLEAELLRKKEQEYLELLDGPEEGMWIVDFKEKRAEFSPKWAKRFGVLSPAPEILFDSIDGYIHKDDLERVINERQEIIKNKQPRFSQEYRVLTAESGYIWILDRGKILYDENGAAVKIYASSMDITARKKAGETLSKALLREKLLGEITSLLLESEGPQAVMEDICRKTVGYIEGDVFFNYVCEGGRLHLNACSGIPSGEAEKLEWLEYGEAICGCAARDGKRIVVTDVQTSADSRVQLLKSFGIQCYASFPLKSDDHIIGTLAFGSRSRNAFTEDELQFLSSVSEHVAIAMNRLMISRALRESEARFRSVLDNSIDVIYRLNIQTGRFEYVSPSAETIMGYTIEQYKAMDTEEAFAMIHPDDLPAMKEALERLNEIGNAEAVYRQRSGSGEYRWISNNMSLTRDHNGRPLYRNGNIRDITGRKRRELNAALISRIEEDFSLISSPEELMASAGEAVREHFGVSRLTFYEADLDSDTITGIFDCCDDGFLSALGPRRLSDYVSEDMVRESRTGRVIVSDDIYLDPRLASRTEAYAKTTVRSQAVASYVKDGKLKFVITAQHVEPRNWREDETKLLGEFAARIFPQVERTLSEQALRESEEKYRQLVEHSPAGIYEVDFRTGKFTSVNDVMCFITGYSREEFLNMTPFQLLDEDNAAKYRKRIKQRMSGEKLEGTVDYKFITKGGREICVLLNVKFINDEKGSPLGASVIAQDITERKRAEEKNNRQNMILQAIKKLYEQYVYCGTLGELGKACLEIIEEITESKISFVGEIGKDGLFHDIAISTTGWEECELQDKTGHKRLPRSFIISGLYGSVLKDGKAVIANDPDSHPDRVGIPKEHVALTSFLGVPLFQNGSVAGMVAVANREGGYTENEKEVLEALAPTVCEVLLRKRAEEALSESESKYVQLVKYAPAGIYEMDFRERRFTSVNDALCLMSGYSREELLGIDPASLMDDRGRATFMARAELWLRGKEPKKNVDYKVKTKDGREIFVSLDVNFKKGEDGNPLGATAVVHDITERKKYEALINRKNRILQAINQIHERSVSCRTMNELELTCLDTVNAVTNSSVSFIGELKGERLMYEISLNSGNEDGVRNVHRRLGRLEKDGLFREVLDTKASLLTNGNSSCPCGTGVSGSDIKISSFLGVPFIRDGNAVGLIAAANHKGGYAEDEKEILEALAPAIYEVFMRKHAEEALKESEERLADEFNAVARIQKISASFVQEGDFESILYNVLKAAIMISGAYKGTLQLLRPGTERLEIAAQLGFDQSYVDFFSTMSISSAGVCAMALEKEERIIVEDVTKSPIFINTPALDVQLAAGVRAVQATPLISRRGKVIGILSTYWDKPCFPSEQMLRYIDLLAGQAADVIERKRAEEELRDSEECALALVKKLEETDRNKNDFLGALSHEIRNPLATISAGLQLMDMSHDENLIKNAREIIDRQMDQLCSLVDDLLDLTRISNNKIELKKQCIELNKLISFVAKDHMPLADRKGLRLETELSEKIYIDADPVRLKQIIGNLLQNAFKFTKTGTITLSANEKNGQAVICVKDSGIGINPENLSRIFEPFMQLDSHIDRQSDGLGLGLSIVKGIAQLHGGDAGVYSEGEGKGSEFYIRLPAIKNRAAGQEENVPAAAEKIKVLVIEDNKDYSEMMCELLRFLGHDVMYAPDGMEGIKKAKEDVPDIIICDIGLPGISGYETARLIREDENLKNVFLVSITGYAGPKYAEDAENAGFDLHIIKPADIDTLKNILNKALSK